MVTVGLTGNIAMGKSTVTKTFRRYIIPVVDADIVARQVVEPGTIGLQQIIDCFGKSFIKNDGTLDRAKLGKLVFCKLYAMNQLNAIMGPLISDESTKQIKCYHDNGWQIVLYDAALICEMNNSEKYRPLIVVSCPREIQLERLIKRNGLTHDDAMARIDSQMPLNEKIKIADYVIDTSKDVSYSVQQTEKIIEHLRVQSIL